MRPAAEDGGGDLVGVLAAGLDHGVGERLVKRRTDLEDLGDLGDGPGRASARAARQGRGGRTRAGAPARRGRPSARRRSRSRGAGGGLPREAPRRRRWRRSPSGNAAVNSARVRSSQSRKTGSPYSAKIAAIDRPARASTSRSASRNGRFSRPARIRPTVDLPVPR